MQAQSKFVLICCKIKFYEDWVSKHNWKIEFFVPSTGHQNCLDKSLQRKLRDVTKEVNAVIRHTETDDVTQT